MASPFLVSLETAEGQKLLQESRFGNLRPYFYNQVNSMFCGLCSAAICLNEILDKRLSFNNSRLTEKIHDLVQLKEKKTTIQEDDILQLGEARSVLRKEDVDEEGITLQTFAKLINSVGLYGRFYYAFQSHESTPRTFPVISSVDEFRSTALENLEKAGSHVVVNYDLAALYPKVNVGHFSPLGGYHFREDMFLLLDVWPYNPICWVKAQKLFDAMIAEDSSSHLPRGFCIISVD